MKILKRPTWKRRIVCPGCQAKLEVTADDVRREAIYMDWECWDAPKRWFVDCPLCRERLFLDRPRRPKLLRFLDRWFLPDHVKRRARSE
ncbi:hypothetical protein AMJ57_03650 [Parcubacteria bacterium SG8_24]|nr:MAG: hypothetical protein AMJ57_03650 [Parcubacteria bacterium SG8_24]